MTIIPLLLLLIFSEARVKKKKGEDKGSQS